MFPYFLAKNTMARSGESSKTGEVSTNDSAAMKDPYTNRFTSKDQRISKNMSNVDLFGVLIFQRKSLDFC